MVRLTKAQKSAIVNKICDEQRKRDNERIEQAIKDFVPTEEEAKILADVDEMNELYDRMMQLAKKYATARFVPNPYFNEYQKEPKSHNDIVREWIKEKLNIHLLYTTEPILNDLEIQTIDSSFDIDEFINKYVK